MRPFFCAVYISLFQSCQCSVLFSAVNILLSVPSVLNFHTLDSAGLFLFLMLSSFIPDNTGSFLSQQCSHFVVPLHIYLLQCRQHFPFSVPSMHGPFQFHRWQLALFGPKIARTFTVPLMPTFFLYHVISCSLAPSMLAFFSPVISHFLLFKNVAVYWACV